MRISHIGILCCVALLAASVLGIAVTGAVKIMPLGDSMTKGSVQTPEEAGHPTYRYWLWNDLARNGYDVDFVGSWNMPNFPNFSFDQDNEGHGGYMSGEILHGVPDDRWEPGNLSQWIQGYDYDMVLLLIGMNDVLHGVPTNETATNIEKIITVLRQKNSKVTVFLGTLPPASYYRQSLIDLNQEIVRIADRTTTATSPVIVVDQYYGYDGVLDNQPPGYVHPDESGEKKIAKNWYDAITPYLRGPTTTMAPTTVPTAIPSAAPDGTYAKAREHYISAASAWSQAWGASDIAVIKQYLNQAKTAFSTCLNAANQVNDPANAANLALLRSVSTAYIQLADAALAMYDGADIYSMSRPRMAAGNYPAVAAAFQASGDRFAYSQVLFNEATVGLQSVSYAGTEYGGGAAYTGTIVPILNEKAAYMGEFSAYARGWQHTALAYQARAAGDEGTFRKEAIQAMNLFAGLQSSPAFGADAVNNYNILAGLLG